jgi:hypothetical protein
MRGRGGGGSNNSNRRGPNPLTRNYESNGPDVKIRGSAQQIAEKYTQLARDAQGAGDRVMAENYLQHAEHYNRIIAAAQAQMPIQNTQSRELADDDLDEDRDDFDGIGNVAPVNGNGGEQQPQLAQGGQSQPQQQSTNLGNAPQPIIEGTPAEAALNAEVGESNRRQEAQTNGAANAGAEGGGHRRPRRPRRGGSERHRASVNGSEPDADAGDGDAASQPSAEGSGKPAVAEGSGPSLAITDS